MNFAIHQASRTGGRKYNQDRVAYAYTNESLLLVLADGMGGHLHGEIAAQTAIHVYMQAFARVAHPRVPNQTEFLQDVMQFAHETILQYAEDHHLPGNPGTTCVAALIQDGQIWWAHAGDSRLYLLRNRKMLPLTHDHSLVQQWADWGIISQEEIRIHPDRNKITNCLGGVASLFSSEAPPPLPLQQDDVLLLCSDGLWGPLEDAEMASILSASPLPTAIEKLMDEALRREGAAADNTTAVVARIGDNEEAHTSDEAVCIVLDYR
jgi:serine/threonine protein phosphatase PrpC